MKTLLLLSLSAILFISPEQEVKFTVYNAVAGQTDSTPLVTADNSKINVKKLNNGSLKWVAVSRDLLKTYNYGDTILVSCKKFPKFDGKWVVRDIMNKRYTKTIDFLVPSNIKLGKGTCKIKKL